MVSDIVEAFVMRRRQLFEAAIAAAVLGAGYAGKAQAQSEPKILKDAAIKNPAVGTATISVEHVTIASQKSFESVKKDLESRVPRLNESVFVLLRHGETERFRRELEKAPILSIFGSRDHWRSAQILRTAAASDSI